jgi:hypothetical protein
MMEHDQQEVTPSWYRAQPHSPVQVYKPDTIRDVQRTLGVQETGELDARTVSHIKGLQQLFGINPSGIIDRETAVQIERLRNRYSYQTSTVDSSSTT